MLPVFDPVASNGPRHARQHEDGANRRGVLGGLNGSSRCSLENPTSGRGRLVDPALEQRLRVESTSASRGKTRFSFVSSDGGAVAQRTRQSGLQRSGEEVLDRNRKASSKLRLLFVRSGQRFRDTLVQGRRSS